MKADLRTDPPQTRFVARPQSVAGGAARPQHEYYDHLLRRLLAPQDGTTPPQVIGLMGSTRGVGATTVVANLAIHAADFGTGAVLLVDADARHAALSRAFSTGEGPGLADALTGEAEILDCIAATGIDRLFVMKDASRGRMPITRAGAAADCMRSLRAEFPLVLVDLPPAGELGACWELIGQLDGIVLVVEAEKTRGEAIRRVQKQLIEMGVPLLGVVLNKWRNYLPRWLNRWL